MYIKRDIEEKIYKRLDSDEILILKGPGQIGKSSLLKKIIKDIGKKEPAYYINLENQLNLEEAEMLARRTNDKRRGHAAQG